MSVRLDSLVGGVIKDNDVVNVSMRLASGLEVNFRGRWYQDHILDCMREYGVYAKNGNVVDFRIVKGCKNEYYS